MPAEPERFAALFNKPTVEEMHRLSPRDFERFVAYVLRRAGYDVKEVGPHWLRGVDLEMRRPGLSRIVGGVECKRYDQGRHVNAPIVRGTRGAPAVGRAGAKPYVVTTSDFNDEAHQMAEGAPKRVYLMNGHQLVRYITYIRGSRRDDDDTTIAVSPEFFCGRDNPQVPHGGKAKILTIANNKGGVGKTTTAYYLGAELAKQGKRVLLIDLDGQANLTDSCFPERDADDGDEADYFPSIAQYFSGQQPLHELVKEVKAANIEHLCIIPSDPGLTLRDLGGSGRPDVEMRFARDIQKLSVRDFGSLGGVPDWIIIDTPPAMSVFTRAGLAAANYVLAPVRPRRRSLPGTRLMLTTLQTMNALTRDNTTFLGMVITHWDDLQVSQGFLDILLPREVRLYGGRAFTEKIPIDNQLETLGPGANTRGAQAYRKLADEVLKYV
jgi:chromosome partitioning protein